MGDVASGTGSTSERNTAKIVVGITVGVVVAFFGALFTNLFSSNPNGAPATPIRGVVQTPSITSNLPSAPTSDTATTLDATPDTNVTPVPAPKPEQTKLATLCNYPGATATDCPMPEMYSIQTVGSQKFRSEARSIESAPPNWAHILVVPDQNCTTVTLRFAVDDTNRNGSTVAHLRVVQDGSAPQSASARSGHVGTLIARLHPGILGIDANADDSSSVYITGTATCVPPT